MRAFLQQQQGAIAIELAFVLVLTTGILAFMADSLVKQAIRGKLDRTAYSLASILREREKFFANTEELTDGVQGDIERLAVLAKAMLPKDSPFALQIAFMTFTENKDIDRQKSRTLEKQVESESRTLESEGSRKVICTLPAMSDNLKDLSAKSARRWVPLYRVTLCMPVKTFMPDIFAILGHSGTVNMQSSAMMLSRKAG